MHFIALLAIYEIFLRPHLGYWNVIYNKPRNEKFIDTVESIPYNTTIAITDDIKGISKEKLHNELEHLRKRQWMQRFCLFHKIFNLKSSKYLYDQIPPATHFYATKNYKNIPCFNYRTECFMNSFS